MNEPNAFPPIEVHDRGSLLRGFVTVLGVAFVHFGLSIFVIFGAGLFARFYLTSVRYIALSQLVYVVPLFIREKRQGHTLQSTGIIIGAAVVVLLNAACWGSY